MAKITRVLLTIIFIIVAAISGCSPKEEKGALKQFEKITLAVTPWPASAPLYVAYEKGYFREEGLDVTLHSYVAGHLGLDAVLSGRADFTTVGETPIARAAIDGKPLAVIATVSVIDQAILIIARRDRGISAANDLRGKRIGLVTGTTADFFLHIYLTTSYINPKSIRVVNLAPDKVVDALLNGEVDAVSTWAPHTMALRDKLGPKGLIFHDPDIYIMTWNIVTTQDLIKKNPERVRKFLRAVLRANRFIKEAPDETRAISAKYFGIDSFFFEREWKSYKFNTGLDQSLLLNLEDQARWLIKRDTGSNRKLPNFMDFIYADGLKAIEPGAVRITGK